MRKFTEHDLPAFFAIFSDEEVNRFLPWFPVKSMEEARAFWQERYADLDGPEQDYRYAICLKQNQIPVGYVNVSMEEHHDLGYGLRKEYWHRGIVTEACRAVIERVKADGIPYITATHDRNNPRSGGVMIQLGMQYQYSYEDQWQPKNMPVIFRMYQLNLDGEENRVYKSYWERSAVHFVETERKIASTVHWSSCPTSF